jgi:hypothetical protein
MTCSECVDALTVAALRDDTSVVATLDATDRAAVEAHCSTCADCRAARQLFVAAEVALAQSLDADVAARPTLYVVEHAWTARRRAAGRRALVALFALIVAAFVWATWSIAAPEVRLLLEPPPPVVVQTFELRCLSPEQAASLLRPYLPMPQNPRWQAERFDVLPAAVGIRAVTVRAPRELIDRVPALLARFERDPGAACRRAP